MLNVTKQDSLIGKSIFQIILLLADIEKDTW